MAPHVGGIRTKSKSAQAVLIVAIKIGKISALGELWFVRYERPKFLWKCCRAPLHVSARHREERFSMSLASFGLIKRLPAKEGCCA